MKKGTTNGWRWRIVRNGNKFRHQVMTSVQGQCAVFGKDADTEEAAVAAVKAWARRQPPAMDTKHCRWPKPLVKYGRAVR